MQNFSTHKFYILCFITIIGIILWILAKDIVFAPGIAIAGFFALLTEVLPFIISNYTRYRVTKEIEVAGIREDDLIFKKILNLLDGSKKFYLMGNILHDFFQGNSGRILIDKLMKGENKNIEIRVCIYYPDKENEYLKRRALDEYESEKRSIDKQIAHLTEKGSEVLEKIYELRDSGFKSLKLR